MGPGAMPAGMIPDAPEASADEIKWKVPRGWKQQPASGMRIGSFLVAGANGRQADVSVVPLGGEAGDALANLNRWRGQINLPAIAPSELSKFSKQMTLGGRQMTYVDLVSSELLVENKYKKRIVAATYSTGGRTWFFKMMGDDATVGAAAAAFKDFLKSLRFPSNG